MYKTTSYNIYCACSYQQHRSIERANQDAKH